MSELKSEMQQARTAADVEAKKKKNINHECMMQTKK